MDTALENRTTREAILEAAEALFSENGFKAVTIREIARRAGANVASISYYFQSKEGLLRSIYEEHCQSMNDHRAALLAQARRVADPRRRLRHILRAYVEPCVDASKGGGGARFTRLRAVMSAEGNPQSREIIARTFDETSRAFIDSIAEILPQLPRGTIVWRSHFLLGSLYYTLINPERVTRLSDGAVDGADPEDSIRQLVAALAAALEAPAIDEAAGEPIMGGLT